MLKVSFLTQAWEGESTVSKAEMHQKELDALGYIYAVVLDDEEYGEGWEAHEREIFERMEEGAAKEKLRVEHNERITMRSF